MYHHIPVLQEESLDLLQPQSNEHFIDGTVGGAGHSIAILEKTGPYGKILGLDVDPHACAIASERLARFGERAHVVRASYDTVASIFRDYLPEAPSGILLDLGLSSHQLDASKRGFSFKDTGTADMRFDPASGTSASDFLMTVREDDLADVIHTFAEIRGARRVAKALIRMRDSARQMQKQITVPMILEALEGAGLRPRRSHTHPATTVFQALRIVTNAELERVERFLPQALNVVRPGGRIAVIAYHSLEDRLIKNFFRKEARDCICPPKTPVCRCGHVRSLKILTSKPVRPSLKEIQINPRSRSARLRVAQKI